MNLLVRTARDLGRLWSVDLAVTLGVVFVMLLVERLGRMELSNSDVYDLLALLLLSLIALGVHACHRRKPLACVRALGAGAGLLGRQLRRATFEIGLDLRGTPRVRRGTPPIV